MTHPQWYLHEKYGIPREINGFKIKVVTLRPDQGVIGGKLNGRLVRQGPANCRRPRCFRIRPIGSLHCPPHEPAV